MTDYKKLMKRCITLAKKARGNTSPNPLVGCVILDKNNNIISEGYHHKYGENHAERDALLKLKNGEEKGGTLIVNLEPCSHHGKTPPCADLIIERKLKKVIIGCKDNNPKVNGDGIKKLIDAGIEVHSGILEEECRNLNEIFFTNIEQNRIFIALKTATTIDGKISTSTGNSKWITSEKSRNYGRKLRKYYDAILTSSSTIIADNPTMNHKTKIILDKSLKTDLSSKIYKKGRIILVIGEKTKCSQQIPNNITILKTKLKNNEIDLKYLLNALYKMNIHSIFVEAGGKLSGAFIKEHLADKIYHFTAPKILNDKNGKDCCYGNTTNQISDCNVFKLDYIKKLENDILAVYKIS